jgi:hypothetical protein
MWKFALIYECFGLQARFLNELCSQTEVQLYLQFRKLEEVQKPNDSYVVF